VRRTSVPQSLLSQPEEPARETLSARPGYRVLMERVQEGRTRVRPMTEINIFKARVTIVRAVSVEGGNAATFQSPCSTTSVTRTVIAPAPTEPGPCLLADNHGRMFGDVAALERSVLAQTTRALVPTRLYVLPVS
jgi:hypothetical protein